MWLILLSVLAGLVEQYVTAFQNGAIPCIESAVQTTTKIENERATQTSLELYK